jgi:16S rRNA (guanine527-N7)-methyltransferase
MLEIVAAGAARLGITLGPTQLGQLARYVDLLLARNHRLNLTRIIEPAEVERRHLLDSLTCALPFLDRLVQTGERPLPTRSTMGPLRSGLPWGPCNQAHHAAPASPRPHGPSPRAEGPAEGSMRPGWRCIDVGSGGGLPGIPLAIAFPELQVTLLESAGKKAAFLREVVDDLGLTGVSVRSGRAEEAARDPAERDAYDLAVARALAPLPVALELCLPFVRPGGIVVLPRGSDLADQLADGEAAAEQLAARLHPPIALDDPELPPGRSLVVAEKLGPTPERFPRRPGMAAKRPLTRDEG